MKKKDKKKKKKSSDLYLFFKCRRFVGGFWWALSDLMTNIVR